MLVARWMQSKYMYSITQKGEYFTKATLNEFGLPSGPPATAAFMNADMREFGEMGIETPPTRNLTSNPFKGIDEEQLFDWIMTAHVGNVKTFSIPKDRRKALHDACDKYQLNMPGLKLIHSSAGTGCQRALQVRICHSIIICGL